MSLSDSNQNVRTYPVISSASSQVPDELMSSSAPRPLASKIQHKVANCQTATQTSSGQLMFNLGCGSGQGFVKSGSVYLSCLVAVTQAVHADNKNKFSNSNGLGSSIILRDTLYLNGNIADQYNYVNKLRQGLVSHCSSDSYVKNDLAITEAPLATTVSANPPTGVRICIPVQNGVLNAQNNLPLFLFSTCQLEFNLDSVGQAIYSAGVAATEYTVTDAKITYTVIQPEIAFEQEMKAILASGKLFQMEIKSFYNLKQSNAGPTKSVPIGLNMSSVNAIFHTCYKAVGDGIQTLSNTSDGVSELRIWLDGELKNSFNINTAPVIYSEMKKALGVYGDPERSSANFYTRAAAPATVALTQETFLTDAFLGGLNLMRTQQSGFSFSGSPVSQAIVEVTNTGTAGSDLYIFVSYSQCLCIDAMGSIQLIR